VRYEGGGYTAESASNSRKKEAVVAQSDLDADRISNDTVEKRNCEVKRTKLGDGKLQLSTKDGVIGTPEWDYVFQTLYKGGRRVLVVHHEAAPLSPSLQLFPPVLFDH